MSTETKEEIEALQNKVEHFRSLWNTSCEHVAESLELLGVDTSVNGYPADTWTLREQCKIAGDKLRALHPEGTEK